MVESCILQIAISQDWVDGFQISQRLWVRKTCEHILKLSWFHNSCKHNFYVIKTPKTHLRLYSHSAVTVCTCVHKCVVLALFIRRGGSTRKMAISFILGAECFWSIKNQHLQYDERYWSLFGRTLWARDLRRSSPIQMRSNTTGFSLPTQWGISYLEITSQRFSSGGLVKE